MNHFWAVHKSSFEFGMVQGLFALSAFVGLWSGVLSLAPVGFGAAAGYTSARLVTDHNLSINWLVLIGALIGGVLALLLSYIFLRLSSHYLALATIALVLITRVLALNLTRWTGGAAGVPLLRTVKTWYLALVLLLACLVFARLRKSKFGLAAEAVREQPEVAAGLGIEVAKIRRVAFVISGVLGGVAGVLEANLLQYLSPDSFYVDLAFVMLAAVVLGGAYHWLGAVVGAAVFTALPEILKNFMDRGERIANGVLLIIIMIYMPRGLVDPERFGFGRKATPQGPPAVADEGANSRVG